MFLFVDYEPNVTENDKGETVSNSKLVVGTNVGATRQGLKMAKLNTFDGDQADLMYGMLVGVDEQGNVKNVEEETISNE
jgi:hypothetical protein